MDLGAPASKQAANQGNVSQDGNFVFEPDRFVNGQASENQSVPVWDDRPGLQLPHAKPGEWNRHGAPASILPNLLLCLGWWLVVTEELGERG